MYKMTDLQRNGIHRRNSLRKEFHSYLAEIRRFSMRPCPSVIVSVEESAPCILVQDGALVVIHCGGLTSAVQKFEWFFFFLKTEEIIRLMGERTPGTLVSWLFFMPPLWVPLSFCYSQGLRVKRIFPPLSTLWSLKVNNQVEYFLFHNIAEDAGLIIWYKVCELEITFSSLNFVFNILWHISE